jgi:AraC family transcriptional regulator of adaptative response / DNA-3-methyladenine glycosylase II
VPGVERLDDRGYARTLLLDGHRLQVVVRPLAGEPAFELEAKGAPEALHARLIATVRRVFDLDADPARVRRHFGKDPLLGPLVARRPGLRIPGMWDPFECAVRAVLGQQVSVAAGRTLAARIVARGGQPFAGADGLTHLFPDPVALAEADLGGLGLTGGRIAALQSLARAVRDGAIDWAAPVAQVRDALVRLPGIGPWTAAYVALRGLGDRDAFPDGDLVLRQMAGQGGRPLTSRELAEKAESWRPWRGYAVIHLWRAATDAVAARKAGP